MLNTIRNTWSQKTKKLEKDNKGFTLVEIIVVLVILSILMAALVPSMIGFVNEARGKAYVTEARSAYVALQSKVTEYNATHTTPYDTASAKTAYAKTIESGDLKNIMEGSYTTGAEITDVAITGSKVTGMVYKVNEYYIKIQSGTAAVVSTTELTL